MYTVMLLYHQEHSHPFYEIFRENHIAAVSNWKLQNFLIHQGLLQFVLIIVTSISTLIQLTVSPKLVQTKGTVNKPFGPVSRRVAVQPEGHATGKSYRIMKLCSFLQPCYENAAPKGYCSQLYLFSLLPVLVPDISALIFNPERQETSASSHFSQK